MLIFSVSLPSSLSHVSHLPSPQMAPTKGSSQKMLPFLCNCHFPFCWRCNLTTKSENWEEWALLLFETLNKINQLHSADTVTGGCWKKHNLYGASAAWIVTTSVVCPSLCRFTHIFSLGLNTQRLSMKLHSVAQFTGSRQLIFISFSLENRRGSD